MPIASAVCGEPSGLRQELHEHDRRNDGSAGKVALKVPVTRVRPPASASALTL